MPFRFVLAPLLRLRESLERQHALRLREATLRVTEMKEAIERLDRRLQQMRLSDQESLRTGMKAAEIHFAMISRAQLARLRSELEKELHNLELAREKIAAEYQQAYRDREALASVQREQRRTYQKEELRRVQRNLDVAFLLERWRNH